MMPKVFDMVRQRSVLQESMLESMRRDNESSPRQRKSKPYPATTPLSYYAYLL